MSPPVESSRPLDATDASRPGGGSHAPGDAERSVPAARSGATLRVPGVDVRPAGVSATARAPKRPAIRVSTPPGPATPDPAHPGAPIRDPTPPGPPTGGARRTVVYTGLRCTGPGGLPEEGAGSTEPPANRRSSVRATDAPGREGRPATGATVLVVEDTEADARLIHDLIGDEHAIEAVSDGETAISTLRSRASRGSVPDLVLLDLRLPGVSGFDVLESLRGEPAFADLPVVVLTNSASEADRERALALGTDEVRTKPMDVDAFERTIAEIERSYLDTTT